MASRYRLRMDRSAVDRPRGAARARARHARCHRDLARWPRPRAPQALTVSREPIGLSLAIEDAAGGVGQPVAGSLAAGDRSRRSRSSAMRSGCSSRTSRSSGRPAPRSARSRPPEERVTSPRSEPGSAHSPPITRRVARCQSGDLVVLAGAPAHIAIEDAPRHRCGDGNRSGLTTDSDGGLPHMRSARCIRELRRGRARHVVARPVSPARATTDRSRSPPWTSRRLAPASCARRTRRSDRRDGLARRRRRPRGQARGLAEPQAVSATAMPRSRSRRPRSTATETRRRTSGRWMDRRQRADHRARSHDRLLDPHAAGADDLRRQLVGTPRRRAIRSTARRPAS